MNCFWKHKWDKWKIIENGEVSKWSSIQQQELRKGTYFVQERKCQDCGKTEREVQELTL